MLDNAVHYDITLDHVRRHVSNGDVTGFIIARAGLDLLGGLGNTPDFSDWYQAKLLQVTKKDWRACRLERCGLDLLISYTAEIMNKPVDMDVN
jgi:hypothetical protein